WFLLLGLRFHMMRGVNNTDFSDLVEFEDPSMWRHMGRRDRENLAELFVWRAQVEAESRKGDPLTSIDLAEQIAGDSARVLRQIGSYWFQQGRRIGQDALLRACHYFERATVVRPKFRLVYWDWATTLTELAVVAEDLGYLVDAEEKFCAIDWERL